MLRRAALGDIVQAPTVLMRGLEAGHPLMMPVGSRGY